MIFRPDLLTSAAFPWAALLVLVVVVLALFCAHPAASQEHERASDLGTDNLDLVSASAAEIREVLAKDPGLLVELKRLIAKEATERGQLVVEQDLEDPAILDRLGTDNRFRALATRLLQRYGYLSPQINPQSPAGQEQNLVLKARADRLARAATEGGPASAASDSACGPRENDRRCLVQSSETPRSSWPESESSDTGCEYGGAGCSAPTAEPPSMQKSPTPEPLRPGWAAPEQEPEVNPHTLTTVSAGYSNDSAPPLTAGTLWPGDSTDRTGTGGNLQPTSLRALFRCSRGRN